MKITGGAEMLWKEVQITTTLEAEEAVVNAFYESGAQGVVIQTLHEVLLIQQDPKVNFVDESLLEIDPDASIITGYFSEITNTDEALYLQGLIRVGNFAEIAC